jgi:hypothetical protein
MIPRWPPLLIRAHAVLRLLAAALLVMIWTAAPFCSAGAKTQTVVKVTSGDHPLYSRIVLDAVGLSYTVNRDGGQLLIRFPEDPEIGRIPSLPRNVQAMRAVPGGVELTVAPAATVHSSRMGTKVVIDIDDAATAGSPLRGGDTATAQNAPVPSAEATAVVKPPPRVSPPTARPAPATPVLSGAPAPDTPAPAVSRPPSTTPLATASVLPPPVLPTPLATSPPLPAAGLPSPLRSSQGKLPAGQPAVETPLKPSPGAALLAPAGADPGQRPRATDSGPIPRPAPPLIGPPDATLGGQAVARSEPVHVEPAPSEPSQPNAGQVGAAQPGATPSGAAQKDAAQKDTVQSDAGQVWPVTRDPLPSGPVAIAAVRARPPSGLVGSAMQIPFPVQVGAALFTRGPDAFVVFDERRPIDLAALRDDPVFGSAVTSIYPAATVIHLILPAGRSAMLSPAAAGWRLSVVAAQPRPAALTPVTGADGMTFAANAPAQVVTITDPQTGGPLIVGTQRVSGQGVAAERRSAEFILPITGQGVVVIPLSDGIALRISLASFVLSGRRGGLILSPNLPMDEAATDAASLTRLFEFPQQTTESLVSRAKQQGIAAAATSALGRGPLRHARAESLIGLGMTAEAQTLLRVAMKDDPREAASPSTIGLAAIAALMAGRPNEAGDLSDPRLTGTDEVALWRAIQAAMADEGSPRAAAILAVTAPMLLTYPEQMRARLLPPVLETMILGGKAAEAERLLAHRENDPRLTFARALLKQAQGDNGGALTLFDEVAKSRSTFDHARASTRATELRLTMGQLDLKAAADALEERLYAWRGDGRELALLLRIAELHRKAGDWRAVFVQLRAVKANFPAQAVEIDRQLKEAFAAVSRDPALGAMKPTDLIALLEENAELMADGPDGEPMRALLAEKLMALDLPKRADPLLAKLMRAAPYGPARAGFGATLATLRLREEDGDGALLALSESNSADMPAAVRERRALITARVEVQRGHTASAVEALAASNGQETEEARAAILERANDWPAARDALLAIAAHTVPDSGMLTDPQLRLMLRVATAAARAGDDAGLASLRDKVSTRLPSGPQADLFRLLTAEPVRGVADLGRARSEMGLARAITADMTPKRPPAKTP